MLWYKYWLDSRWTFLAIMAVVFAASVVPIIWGPFQSMEWLQTVQHHGHFRSAVPEVAEALDTYRGYLWARWFREEMLAAFPGMALMMGVVLMVFVVSLQSFSPNGTAIAFTLSLPITRRRIIAVGATTVAVELACVAIAPSLLLPVISSLRDQSYAATDAIIHALLMTVGSLVFFSLSFLLTSILKNGWVVMVLGLVGHFLLLGQYRGMTESTWWNRIYRIMSGESYFLSGQIPWSGLLVSTVLAMAMFYVSIRIFERGDF